MVSYVIIIVSIVVFNCLHQEVTLKSIRTPKTLVKTSSGWILGKETRTVDLGKPYISFSGIPYGEPPVGDLRFRAPVPVKPWNGIKNVTEKGNSCVQLTFGDEDCLNLNIYVPQLDETEIGRLPVIVYIHGGFFMCGDAGYKLQAPDYFLEEDVIFVSINYRVDIFGFLSTEDELAYGNWGLKDQILALEWVKENIENFGGNKFNITLMGQSAGSASVHYLLQTPKAKGLFHRAIMLSGTTLNSWSFTRSPRSSAFLIGSLVSVDTENSTALLKQLREIEPHTLSILSMVLNILLIFIHDWKEGFLFSPSREPPHDGAIVLGYNHENLENGDFNNIPILMGFVSQEAINFYPAFNVFRPYLLQYDLFKERLIPGSMNVDSLKKKQVADEIKQKCFGDSLVVSSTTDLIQFITEDQFTRPIMESARIMANFTRLYLYRFSYMGEENVTDGTGIGVGHGDDLNYLFYYGYTNQSTGDILTRQKFVKLCSNFAKTSYPNLEDVSWPIFTENGTYLDIGKNLTLRNDLDSYRFHWWSYLYNTYGQRPFNTY
ncbi:carboxylesterase 1D-like isoform X1 [Diorhabda sublineata]|uniref:carboxylesterase 1D-like isoform X1 n=1 Tax=Diorhabda sublineata TaxID=1163346 RepID=UPI0024E08D79|nr:carboxylesterase 1D-like isoform X1 [Diorhabda sublineata]